MKKRTDNGAREENYLEIKHFLTVRQSNKVFFLVLFLFLMMMMTMMKELKKVTSNYKGPKD